MWKSQHQYQTFPTHFKCRLQKLCRNSYSNIWKASGNFFCVIWSPVPLFLLWEWSIQPVDSLSHRSPQLSILVLSKEEERKFICAQQEVELEKKRTKAMLMCRNSSLFAYCRKPAISSLTYRDVAGGKTVFSLHRCETSA